MNSVIVVRVRCLVEREVCGGGRDRQRRRNAQRQSKVGVADMSKWGIEANGVVVVGDGVKDNLFDTAPKRYSVVVLIGELPYYQPFESNEFAAATESLHHAVDVI